MVVVAAAAAAAAAGDVADVACILYENVDVHRSWLLRSTATPPRPNPSQLQSLPPSSHTSPSRARYLHIVQRRTKQQAPQMLR